MREKSLFLSISILCLAGLVLIAGGCKSKEGAGGAADAAGYQLTDEPSLRIGQGDIEGNMEKARLALGRMGFRVEKFDTDNGFIRTYPAGGGQFFELWKPNNTGAYNLTMANTSSIARIVELDFYRQGQANNSDKSGGQSQESEQAKNDEQAENSRQDGENRAAGSLNIECRVFVKRLSLDRDDSVSVADMRRAFTETSGGYSRLSVSPEEAVWLDLGRDRQLEAKLLSKITKN